MQLWKQSEPPARTQAVKTTFDGELLTIDPSGINTNVTPYVDLLPSIQIPLRIPCMLMRCFPCSLCFLLAKQLFSHFLCLLSNLCRCRWHNTAKNNIGRCCRAQHWVSLMQINCTNSPKIPKAPSATGESCFQQNVRTQWRAIKNALLGNVQRSTGV